MESQAARMWMNAAETVCAFTDSASTAKAPFCAFVRPDSSSMTMQPTVKTKMSARSLGAQCVVPGAVRTPSALIGASWVARPALREPQIAILMSAATKPSAGTMDSARTLTDHTAVSVTKATPTRLKT